MFDLFSDIFTYRNNILLGVDPRAKLLAALSALTAVMLARHVLLPFGIFALCTISMVLVGVPCRLIASRLAAPLGVALVLLALKTFFGGTSHLFSIDLFSWRLTATRDGLAEGALLFARVAGAVSLVILLGFVTPAYRIFQALRWLRVPEEWLDIAVLVYRYVFVLLERTANLAAAQRVRLGFAGVRRSVDTAGMLAGATFLQSFEQALRVHESMRLRCYGGSLRLGALPPMTKRDALAAALAVAAVCAAYLLAEGRLAL